MIFSIPFIIFNDPQIDNIIIALLGFSFAITVNAEAQNYMAILLGCDIKGNKRAFSFNPLTHLDILSLTCFVFLGFGWAKKISADYKGRKFRPVIIKLSGAIANFFFANIIASILYVLGNMSPELSNEKALNIILIINLSFFIYNLILPISPLSLGNALSSLIFSKNHQNTERKIYIVGVIILAAFFCLDYFLFHEVIFGTLNDFITNSYFFIKA